MRDHSNHKSAGRREVIEALLSRIEFARVTESVPVAQADGRVAAKEYRSRNVLPNKLTCNMDGIGVYFDDFAHGMPDISDWERGKQWQFANTGVAMPADFDTAIAIERVQVSDDGKLLSVDAVPEERFSCTTPIGANLQEGDLLVEEGELLNPVLLSVLNMGGYTEVEVYAKPKVAFIPTGNELVAAGGGVPEGKNVDTNATMVCAKIAQWGGEPVRFDIVPDDPDQILAALKKATAECDIIAINAGSSKGSDDWTCEILEREGEVLFHEALQAPGKHSSFSILDGKPVIGISGPPFAAELNVDIFLKPFIDVFIGVDTSYAPVIMARMLDNCPLEPRRVTLVKRACVRRAPDGDYVAWQLSTDARPKMRACAQANALLFLDKDGYGYEKGDYFPVELNFPYSIPPMG